MNSYWSWMVETLRPLYASSLPEELALPPIPLANFRRGEMYRSACIFNQPDNPTEVFQLVGPDLAPRAARAWRPREFYLMEDISLSFHLVEQQRQRGIIVDSQHIDRLVLAIQNYRCYLGSTSKQEAIRSALFAFLDANSVADPITAAEAQRPVCVDHPLLEALNEVDREAKARINPQGLGSLGLLLDGTLVANYYPSCTPRNCRTFASTGGECVHFSLLIQEGAITSASPVIMTTPTFCGQSLILGENLHDFLCLGSRWGYFALECIGPNPENETMRAYTDSQWRPTTKDHASQGLDLDDEKLQVLNYLRESLGLRPWSDASRLARLQREYWPRLHLPPDVASSPLPQ